MSAETFCNSLTTEHLEPNNGWKNLQISVSQQVGHDSPSPRGLKSIHAEPNILSLDSSKCWTSACHLRGKLRWCAPRNISREMYFQLLHFSQGILKIKMFYIHILTFNNDKISQKAVYSSCPNTVTLWHFTPFGCLLKYSRGRICFWSFKSH